MADSKITALTALTSADPANDMFPVVDVSDTSMAASGTTKRISINNLLACSPSATLASATITGDLTVDTSTLKVDSTNNRVGIKQASPSHPFQIGTTDLISDASANLGIGITPSAWASNYRGIQMRESYAAIFSDNGNGVCEITSNAYNDGAWKYANATKAARYQLDAVSGQHEWYTAGTGTVGGTITDFATAKMTLDGSGNLLLGTVTSPTGTKIGSIAKLGKVSVEGTSTVTVTTSATALARAYDTGGLFFVSGFNNVGGSRGWWLVAAGGTAPVVIASDNLTGLTVAFTSPSGVLSMNTASGSLSVTAISLTNQGV